MQIATEVHKRACSSHKPRSYEKVSPSAPDYKQNLIEEGIEMLKHR